MTKLFTPMNCIDDAKASYLASEGVRLLQNHSRGISPIGRSLPSGSSMPGPKASQSAPSAMGLPDYSACGIKEIFRLCAESG